MLSELGDRSRRCCFTGSNFIAYAGAPRCCSARSAGARSAVACATLSRRSAGRCVRLDARVAALGTRCVRGKSAQTLLRADDHRRLLLVDGAWIGMAADAEVLARPAPVLVADVPLAHIAGQHQNLLGRSILACLAPAHGCLDSRCPEHCGNVTLHAFRPNRRTFRLAIRVDSRCRYMTDATPRRTHVKPADAITGSHSGGCEEEYGRMHGPARGKVANRAG
jgi:hypothetical protein